MASGIGKKVGSILERVDGLEQGFSQFVQVVQQGFNTQGSKADNTDKVLMAVVDLLGKDVVSAKVEEQIKAKIQADADQAKANLEAALAKGDVALSEAGIGEGLVIVGREVNKDGVDVFPGRVQTFFANLKPDIQTAALSKKAGDCVDIEDGSKLFINEIYEFVKKDATETAELTETVQ